MADGILDRCRHHRLLMVPNMSSLLVEVPTPVDDQEAFGEESPTFRGNGVEVGVADFDSL